MSNREKAHSIPLLAYAQDNPCFCSYIGEQV